ncbi:hypothetical protein HPB50_018007 [Hyalomma asiaticum]|uniref:Uncharacterized protein n=1 Tax=Hyalomma asiaticum TaxID=266040 RepID=A0ACB7RLG6_HYAAI|nr:hypothetical protein HPB50_018007 [Hyalomma asiaticum]
MHLEHHKERRQARLRALRKGYAGPGKGEVRYTDAPKYKNATAYAVSSPVWQRNRSATWIQASVSRWKMNRGSLKGTGTTSPLRRLPASTKQQLQHGRITCCFTVK